MCTYLFNWNYMVGCLLTLVHHLSIIFMYIYLCTYCPGDHVFDPHMIHLICALTVKVFVKILNMSILNCKLVEKSKPTRCV